MAKVTEYPRITKMKDNDILLVDGPDGTRTILQTDASKQMGAEVIMVNESAGDSTKVVINTTDEDVELATMADLEPVEEDVSELKTHLTGVDKTLDDYGNIFGESIIYPDITNGSPTNPNNQLSVTTDFIPIHLNDKASCVVALPLSTGQEYRFSYALYDSTKTFISGINNPTVAQRNLTISNASAAFLKWGIFRYDTTVSDYVAFRTTDFSGGDIKVNVVHNTGIITDLSDLKDVNKIIDDYGNIIGESIIYPSITNGSPTNPNNQLAVTTDFIPISINDKASCVVSLPLSEGQEYRFSYALYDSTKTYLSGDHVPATAYQTITINDSSAAYLKWGILRYDNTASDYIAFRTTDFSGGDIKAEIVHNSGIVDNLTQLNNAIEEHEEYIAFSAPAAIYVENKNAFINLYQNPGTITEDASPWGYKIIKNIPYGSIFKLKTLNNGATRARAYRWKYPDGTWSTLISASDGFDGEIICPVEGATLFINSLTDDFNPVVIYCGNAYTSIESNGRVSRFPASKISIIGDSISTFDEQGFMVPGYATYYPRYTVVNVFQTWWWKVIAESGAKLEVNASYSGSCASDLNPTAPSFYARTSLIGSPDLIFIELGTNDQRNGVPLGEYDYETPYENLPESTFRTAYIKGIKALLANNPNAHIVCLGARMADPYKASIQTIVQHFINEHYSIEYINLGDYSYHDNVHPSYAGMREIASKILFS